MNYMDYFYGSDNNDWILQSKNTPEPRDRHLVCRQITEEEIKGFISNIKTEYFQVCIQALRQEIENAIAAGNKDYFMELTKVYNIMMLEV